MANDTKHRRRPVNMPRRPALLKGVSVGEYDDLVMEGARAKEAAASIMSKARNHISKGWVQAPNAPPSRAPKSWFNDPFTLQYSLGYKDRQYSLTYDMLKQTATQLSFVGAIINLRAHQIASFAAPYRHTRSLGFVIKHKDPDHKTTEAELKKIKEIEQFILNCGRSESNPYSNVERYDFEDFLKALVRDSLTYDQACAEIIPDHYGIPFEFYPVDAATIRIASDDRHIGINSSYHSRTGFVPSAPARFANLYDNKEYGKAAIDGNPVAYVQIVNGQIENVYSRDELAFGVRNPRTDIYIQGYGFGEIEQLITIVTSHIYAEDYNKKFFSQGSAPKGLINMRGEQWSPEMLEDFKRQWRANLQGVENAWQTPIMQVPEGVEWVDLNKTNREMEFNSWIEYLIKIISAVFLVDPAELNFDMQGGVQQTPLFESSSEWKLKASKDKGLKPLLGFLAKFINKNIIDKIDDHFAIEFVGLDEMSEEDKHNMLVEQLSSYMTLNEVRRRLDLPDLPNGDIPMNPTYMQALETKMQMDAQKQEQEQAQEPLQEDPAPEEQMPEQEEQGLPGSVPEEQEEPPQYADHQGMSDPNDVFKALFIGESDVNNKKSK